MLKGHIYTRHGNPDDHIAIVADQSNQIPGDRSLKYMTHHSLASGSEEGNIEVKETEDFGQNGKFRMALGQEGRMSDFLSQSQS